MTAILLALILAGAVVSAGLTWGVVGRFDTARHGYGDLVQRIESLELGRSLTRILGEAGVTTLSELASRNRREIGGIPGIGSKSVDKIEEAVRAVGLELADDPLAPYRCVREGRNAWDVRLCSFFLCGDCVDGWTESAFRCQGPRYNHTLPSGTCQNCNKESAEI